MALVQSITDKRSNQGIPRGITKEEKDADSLMPFPIEYKTAGQLIDESQVIWLKIQHGAHLKRVYHMYEVAVSERFASMPNQRASTKPATDLMELNKRIWDLIDRVMAWDGKVETAFEIARVAYQVQTLNRERVALIAAINDAFQEPNYGAEVKIY